MIALSPQIRVFLYRLPTDMRKSFNGLVALTESALKQDPLSGSLFVFVNRSRDRLKILYFDGGGFWLYYRLLEAGTFEELKNHNKSSYLTIDATELSMLLSGVSLMASGRRRKRYSKKQTEQAA